MKLADTMPVHRPYRLSYLVKTTARAGPSGVYLLKVINATGVDRIKLVKQ